MFAYDFHMFLYVLFSNGVICCFSCVCVGCSRVCVCVVFRVVCMCVLLRVV